MKYKTTAKATRNHYKNIICVGYCNLQTMLNTESPAAYTTRREGWAADIYDFGNTAIVTGYAPFGNIEVRYSDCEPYERQAREICDATYDYTERKAALDKLIKQFITNVTK